MPPSSTAAPSSDPKATDPARYLIDRGFEALLDEIRWTIGYAPPGWTRLRDQLTSLGYTDETLLTAGLTCLNRRGTPIDCFRDRLTFGIRDTNRQLVGFTARCSPHTPLHVPKYLNTRTTSIYDKSQVLFGLGEATDPDPGPVVLTEGPLDTVAADLACIDRVRPRPLALCGTAVTQDTAPRSPRSSQARSSWPLTPTKPAHERGKTPTGYSAEPQTSQQSPDTTAATSPRPSSATGLTESRPSSKTLDRQSTRSSMPDSLHGPTGPTTWKQPSHVCEASPDSSMTSSQTTWHGKQPGSGNRSNFPPRSSHTSWRKLSRRDDPHKPAQERPTGA